MNHTQAEHRINRCHAGLDPASSLHFWIPAFAGMTIHRPENSISSAFHQAAENSTLSDKNDGFTLKIFILTPDFLHRMLSWVQLILMTAGYNWSLNFKIWSVHFFLKTNRIGVRSRPNCFLNWFTIKRL
jgi:hypothetical protein